MSHVIEVVEVDGKPTVAQLQVEMGEPFGFYLLPEEENPELRGLRQTVLRRGDHDPPEGSLLLMEMMLAEASGRGVGAAFRINRVGTQVRVYLSAPEGRSRVSRATRLNLSNRLEVTCKGRRGVTVVLRIVEGTAGLVSSAGGGTRRSTAVDPRAGARWQVPTFPMLLRVPYEKIFKAAMGLAKRLGLSPAALALLVSAVMVLGAAGYTAWTQHQAAKEAEAKAQELADAAAAADAAADAARESEAACLNERQDLVKQLEDQLALWQLWAEEALNFSLSRTVAIERGGGRMANDAVTAYEDPIALRDRVVLDMRALRGAAENADKCLQHENQLGKDLPLYVLMWHPDPELVCPEDYQAVEGSVARAGRWGLSDRVATEFGSPLGANSGGEDVRMIDRWSAKTLSKGLRDIQMAILGAETRSRPPVAPAELHLWSLTFFAAYNAMPSPADGVMNAEAGECVQTVVEALAQSSGAAEAGKPVLPSVLAVAVGEESVPLVPTSACPWPTGDTMSQAAKSALRAIAHTAKTKGEEKDEG